MLFSSLTQKRMFPASSKDRGMQSIAFGVNPTLRFKIIFHFILTLLSRVSSLCLIIQEDIFVITLGVMTCACLFPSVFSTDHRVPSSHLLLDQLPSYQSLLYRRKSNTSGSARRRGSGRVRQPSVISGKWLEQKIVHSGEELRPVRELPKSMEDKRQEK